jgi:hypothetical protein
MIQVDSESYSPSEAPNLQNIEFFDSAGNLIPSWLESGNSNISTDTLYWLNLPNGLWGNNVTTVYMGFASESTNLFNPETTGEAPELSPVYGEYDDGINVFTEMYTNFAGTSEPLDWSHSIASDGTVFYSNGLSLSGGSTGNMEYFNTQVYPGGVIFDIDDTSSSYGILNAYWATSAPNSIGGNKINFYTGSPGVEAGGGKISSTHYSLGASNGSSYATATAGMASVPNIISNSWQSSNYASASFNYANNVSISNALPKLGFSYPVILNSASYIQIGTCQWARIRTYPPNGVMPSVSFGPLVSVPPSVSNTTMTSTTTLMSISTLMVRETTTLFATSTLPAQTSTTTATIVTTTTVVRGQSESLIPYLIVGIAIVLVGGLIGLGLFRRKKT